MNNRGKSLEQILICIIYGTFYHYFNLFRNWTYRSMYLLPKHFRVAFNSRNISITALFPIFFITGFSFCSNFLELVDDERSRSWAYEVRQRAFSEMSEAGVSQELFANTTLAAHQAHLSRLLSGIMRPDSKLEGRREADLRQIEAFLKLPKRTRQDIYEHVASDPEGFLLAAKLHVRRQFWL